MNLNTTVKMKDLRFKTSATSHYERLLNAYEK